MDSAESISVGLNPKYCGSRTMANHAQGLIDFLEQHWWTAMTEHATRHPLGPTPEESLNKLEELRQEFRAALSQMSTEQLLAAVTEVIDEQDQSRPFNHLGTDADYEHFGRCAFLTVPEAVALSLGKDPRFVSWPMVQPFLGNSIFAFEYAKRFDLIERAVIWQELQEFFTPLQFLTWAHQYKLPVPDAFIQCTFDRGEPIQYWHDLCEGLHANNVKLRAELEGTRETLADAQAEKDEQAQRTFEEWLNAQDQIDRINDAHDAQTTALKNAIEQLEKQNAALTEQINSKSAESSPDEAVVPSERKSFLTMTIAMAVDGYGYDPRDSKSPVPREIADAAHRVGLKFTDDTARKYLKQGSNLDGFTAINVRRVKPKSEFRKPKSV